MARFQWRIPVSSHFFVVAGYNVRVCSVFQAVWMLGIICHHKKDFVVLTCEFTDEHSDKLITS